MSESAKQYIAFWGCTTSSIASDNGFTTWLFAVGALISIVLHYATRGKS